MLSIISRTEPKLNCIKHSHTHTTTVICRDDKRISISSVTDNKRTRIYRLDLLRRFRDKLVFLILNSHVFHFSYQLHSVFVGAYFGFFYEVYYR